MQDPVMANLQGDLAPFAEVINRYRAVLGLQLTLVEGMATFADHQRRHTSLVAQQQSAATVHTSWQHQRCVRD